MKTHNLRGMTSLTPLVAAALLAGCGGGGGEEANELPQGVAQVSAVAYRATTPGAGNTAAGQDLLTAGLGRTGLGSAAVPAMADPLNPTALELRRNAIHANYRAILDPSVAGGYGRLYGPNIDVQGADTLGEGMVPGVEYLGVLDDGSGTKQVAMVVQIPDSFDKDRPCVVVGPSSGSRGVYGSIGSTAEWGLKRGCAVALTDAGKGMGLHDLKTNTVNRVDGTRAERSAAGTLSHFAAQLSDAARAAFVAALPDRLALKHVHSQRNPEREWGHDTLMAVRYALYALNQEFADPVKAGSSERQIRYTPANTLVIAGSVSNGGAAVLQAAEQDTEGLIDGVVASEPSAQPAATQAFGIAFDGVPVGGQIGRPLLDYFTYGNLYQPCAVLAADAALAEPSIFNYMGLTAMTTRAENRCTALAARGLVTGDNTAQRAADALNRLRAYGWSVEHDTMHNAHYGLGNSAIIAMMYTNALGRFSVADNLCGMSLAQVDATGNPVPATAAVVASSFAIGNGTANGAPASVVHNESVGGAKSWAWAVSPTSGTADFALDAALCQRALVTGVDPVTGAALTAQSVPTLAQSQAVQAGMREVLLNGRLQGKPTVIVSGRNDALVPVNHSSRAYAAFNRAVEGTASRLVYVEVTNAQHFDAFLPLSGFDNRYVPLHPYFNAAMDAMYAHLRSGAALPASQVVRATPRGGAPGAAPALAAANLPPMLTTPAAGDVIGYSGTTLQVPR